MNSLISKASIAVAFFGFVLVVVLSSQMVHSKPLSCKEIQVLQTSGRVLPSPLVQFCR